MPPACILPRMPVDPHHLRSIRRSRIRRALLLALAALGTAYLGGLAAAAGTTSALAHRALHGRLPDYRPALAPVALGLVRVEEHADGALYALTASGRALAAELAAAPDVGPVARAVAVA